MSSVLLRRITTVAGRSSQKRFSLVDQQQQAAGSIQSLLPSLSALSISSPTCHNNINYNSASIINYIHRPLSTSPSPSPLPPKSLQDSVIAVGPDGTKYDIPLKPLGNYNQRRHAPKLKPRFKNARISKLRTASGSTKNIRHSPWRLNLVCQFAAGQTVPDALLQLQYCEKVKAPLVRALIARTVNTAKQKYGLLPSQLEVSECFATHSTHLKRIKIMGRGRAGKKLRRHSHMRIVLREIDFPLKIMMSTSRNERDRWVKRMEVALEDQSVAEVERKEIEALERELEVQEARKKEQLEKK